MASFYPQIFSKEEMENQILGKIFHSKFYM